MDSTTLATFLGLPGRPITVHESGALTDDDRQIVLDDGDLELHCPWRRPETWNGVTVVLPWYDVPSLFADAPPDPNSGFERAKFPVADDLLDRGFGIVVVPWWAEAMAGTSPIRDLHERYGPPAARTHADGWRTGLGRSLRDIVAVVDVLAASPDEAGTIATWGHSLGGKLALFTTAVDHRVRACVTHELGFGWEHSNWWDPWYFGDLRPDFACTDVLRLVAPRPILYGAGHGFDGDPSLIMVRSVVVDDWHASIIEHHNGHRPPADALQQSYDWLAEHT